MKLSEKLKIAEKQLLEANSQIKELKTKNKDLELKLNEVLFELKQTKKPFEILFKEYIEKIAFYVASDVVNDKLYDLEQEKLKSYSDYPGC